GLPLRPGVGHPHRGRRHAVLSPGLGGPDRARDPRPQRRRVPVRHRRPPLHAEVRRAHRAPARAQRDRTHPLRRLLPPARPQATFLVQREPDWFCRRGSPGLAPDPDSRAAARSDMSKYWLMKTEPETFSIDDLKRVGIEPWTGVRSVFARFHMRAMSVGD